MIRVCGLFFSTVILNEMRGQPDTELFAHPVSSKNVPDYYNIVTRPMDLQKIREKLHDHAYHAREEFLVDVNQIVENSKLYNGPKSPLTHAAERMLELCCKRFAEKVNKTTNMLSFLLVGRWHNQRVYNMFLAFFRR